MAPTPAGGRSPRPPWGRTEIVHRRPTISRLPNRFRAGQLGTDEIQDPPAKADPVGQIRCKGGNVALFQVWNDPLGDCDGRFLTGNDIEQSTSGGSIGKIDAVSFKSAARAHVAEHLFLVVEYRRQVGLDPTQLLWEVESIRPGIQTRAKVHNTGSTVAFHCLKDELVENRRSCDDPREAAGSGACGRTLPREHRQAAPLRGPE